MLNNQCKDVSNYFTGFGILPILNCIYLLLDKTTGLTAFQSAMIAIDIALGLQIGLTASGFLLCNMGYMSIVYSILIGCFLKLIILGLICVTISHLVKKHITFRVTLTEFSIHF